MAKKSLVLLVAVGLAACGGSDPDLPLDSTISELSESQRADFCARMASPALMCPLTLGSPDDGDSVARVDACVDQFLSLPNCTVGQYRACMDDRTSDPCTSILTPACEAVASCPPVNPHLTGGQMSRATAAFVCGLEVYATPLAGYLVWTARRFRDRCFLELLRTNPGWASGNSGNLAYTYCVEYSVRANHYAWVSNAFCP